MRRVLQLGDCRVQDDAVAHLHELQSSTISVPFGVNDILVATKVLDHHQVACAAAITANLGPIPECYPFRTAVVRSGSLLAVFPVQCSNIDLGFALSSAQAIFP
jgi:hypothetical protein